MGMRRGIDSDAGRLNLVGRSREIMCRSLDKDAEPKQIRRGLSQEETEQRETRRSITRWLSKVSSS